MKATSVSPFVTSVAYVSSKIFNSSHSILEFLKKNVTENDKLVAGIKKRLYELLIEFTMFRSAHVEIYLP